MSLAVEEFNFNLDDEFQLEEKDNLQYNQYLLYKAKAIPDVWKVRNKYYESEHVPDIYFNKLSSELNIYIKAYAYELLYYYGLEVCSVTTNIQLIYRFTNNFFNGNLTLKIDSNFKDAYENYLNMLKEAVRNKVLKDDTNDSNIKNWKLSPRTAITYANGIYKFIIFLNNYTKKHTWVRDLNILDYLPKNFSKYFSKGELQVYRNVLRSIREEDKANKAIPYTTLYDLMKFIYNQKPSYTKTAMIIMAHTGLRISEVRGLKIDCLVKVTDTEIKRVNDYIYKISKATIIKPDYSESYWLTGHFIFKGKGQNPIEGVPILVGKQVKKAINELIEFTSIIRKETDSEYLFIGKSTKKGVFSVRSYPSLLNERNTYIKKGMPFVRFHQFRVTFATILYDLKVPIGMIEKYLNHVRSDVTAGYITSERERDIDIMNAILSKQIVGNENDSAYIKFEKALALVITSFEFAGMSFSSQVSFFKRLLKEYDIKINFADHGACVMPIGEICPNGYENVNPCHTSGCQKFKPDVDEKQFFVQLLSNRKKQKSEVMDLLKQHDTMKVDLSRFDNDIKSVENIISWIDKVE